MRSSLSHFRPVYEVRSVFWFGAAALVLAFSAMPYGGYFALACLAAFLLRGTESYLRLKFWMSISVKWITKMPIGEFLTMHRRVLKEDDALVLGIGFEWKPMHTQMAYDVMRMPHTDHFGLPKAIPKKIRNHLERALAPAGAEPSPAPQGVAWIHGLETKMRPVPFALSALPGHTGIAGATGAGKTVTYAVISTQVIHTPDQVLLIIDPKNDRDWKNRVEQECLRTGRKFLYWKQAEPSVSIRLNPLENWSQPSEIASRVSNIMEDSVFKNFAFLFIDRAVRGELYIGAKPTLRSILTYTQQGIDQLLEQCLVRFFTENGVHDYEGLVATLLKKMSISDKSASRLKAMQMYYEEHFLNTRQAEEAINGLIATFKHDRDHYQKVIVSLMPLLQMLATGETGLMLAPDTEDFDDDREIWDINKIINQKAVLYVGLDSLSNPMVAKAIGSLILADIAAVAGAIYNFHTVKRDIVVMIDEVAEALNEQVIQILNKGRGAGFKAFVAFQTRSDIQAKLQDAAKMLQVLGNLNNQIVLRSEDPDTAAWFSEKVGKTAIKTSNISSTTSSATEGHALEFGGALTRSTSTEEVPLIPPDLILKLPNLQFFARVSGGSVWQGRIPIIEG